MRCQQLENIFLQLNLTLFLTRNVFDPLLRVLFRPLVLSSISERASRFIVFTHIEVGHTEHQPSLVRTLHTATLQTLLN